MVGTEVHGIAVEPAPFDLLSASEADARARHALAAAIGAELHPGDPLAPMEYLRLGARHLPAFARRREWAVWSEDGSRMVGWARLQLQDLDSNRDQADVKIDVAPEMRRCGVGRCLLTAATKAALDDGRTLLNFEAPDSPPGTAFLEAVGASKRLTYRLSRLATAEVDPVLLEAWIERAAERASGYALIGWDGPCADEHLEAFTEAIQVMNTAPRDDLEEEDEFLTPDQLRDYEATQRARGEHWWTLCAREDTTGRLVGYTELEFWPWSPTHVEQGDTGVDPGHRDRGLGRWLKAANLQRLLRDRPEARYVDTGNATSNDAMLAINVALGFRPHLYGGYWQLHI
jgi:GNAT superfamily N-acetyltransferase